MAFIKRLIEHYILRERFNLSFLQIFNQFSSRLDKTLNKCLSQSIYSSVYHQKTLRIQNYISPLKRRELR